MGSQKEKLMQRNTTTKKLYAKVQKLEKEIKKVKLALLKKRDHEIASITPVSLKGIWKGAEITDKDIKTAKNSLFPKRKNLGNHS